jgi:hypothetical protein
MRLYRKSVGKSKNGKTADGLSRIFSVELSILEPMGEGKA